MRNRLLLACALIVGLRAQAQPDAIPGEPVVRYDGHRVVTVTPRGVQDLRALGGIGIEPFVCEVPREGPCEFLVPPDRLDALVASGIPFTVVVENLQQVVDAERARLRGPQARTATWFDDYKNLDAVEAYMAELAALRPDLVTLLDLGTTIEGRSIRAMRIANDTVDVGHCKPAMLLNSVQHAREWITVMNTMYVADQLVRNHGTDPYLTQLVDNADFLIVPVANPDGYVYTWTTERYWRKNRRHNSGDSYGVDLNRNWGVAWGTPLPSGAAGTSVPSSDVYWGTGPFSEPETQRLRDFTLAHPEIKSHNDVHSYGQLILWSWGWSPQPCPQHAEWTALANAMRDLIRIPYNRIYRPGPIYTNIYPVAGGSVDWFYGELGILSMSYELRGGSFSPPRTDILPCAIETFPATCLQAEAMIDRYQFITDWNHDCIHDILDVLEFISDFDAADPSVDLNPDGEIDILDVLEFVQLFSERR